MAIGQRIRGQALVAPAAYPGLQVLHLLREVV